MANIDPLNLTPLSKQYGSTTAGQVVTPAAASGGGDSVGLQGSYTLLRFQTTGTSSNITLNSVELSNFGTDVDVTIAMAATQIRKVAIKNDGRFANAATGRLDLTYSATTGLTVEAEYLG